MGQRWGPALAAGERAGCVVSARGAERPGAQAEGPWSCSGVLLSRRAGLVLCHGGIVAPFLRAGAGALQPGAGPTFLGADSCRDDLRLHVQWGPGRGPEARAGARGALCTPPCSAQPAAHAPARARLLLLVCCPAFRASFARLFGGETAEQWRFAGGGPEPPAPPPEPEDEAGAWADEGPLLAALGWFALLSAEGCAEAAAGPRLSVGPAASLSKGAPLLACGSPFGAFCPDIFLNSLSRGVLSNAAGPLLLTDARCLPGTEGAGVFSSDGALVALVAAPLCWRAREWVGLSLLCAADALLRAAAHALGRLGRRAEARLLAALLPPDDGDAAAAAAAPWNPSLLPEHEAAWVSAVLVECGSVWGSGVVLAPRLVLTCRHVAPQEAKRVLVRPAAPKSSPVWGKVVFATQDTSPYDVAVVKLEEDLRGVPFPDLASHFHEGEDVRVVGFGAFGQACGPSVTSGILSAVVKVNDSPVMLQTTCAVHGGSSGGPLFTDSGELLGIVTSNTRDNSTGATYPHLNFSIPMAVLEPALDQYRRTGALQLLRELDRPSEQVRVVWRLQRVQAEPPRSKL
ncbi:peroxisomal leader peptide-processing protease isoform X2 [Dromiciops gliroides]|uniref:peroxisomal leader peptide-processing protease isoform X2 n=1 Tax=Dromiciops gliroides TaxID=33562 RepID=UPI001CC566FC|nr:peroxisomal leader peptide-processing protease isoform X2 [Dromiciops gliroides]